MGRKATSRTIPIGIVGPSDTARQISVQSARTVNFFPEVAGSDAKAVVALHSVPGIAPFSVTALATPTRGQFVSSAGRRFVVGGIYIYEILANGGGTLTWGNLPTSTGRVCITENAGKIIFGDGTGFYILNVVAGTLTQLVTVNGDVLRGTISLFIDQFTLYIQRDSGRVFYSAIADPTTVDDLDFFTAEGSPDNIIMGLVVNQEIILFGPSTVEFWYNSGGSDNAFARISGGLIQHGCAAMWSAKAFDNSAVFVGQDADGGGIVWRLGSAGAPPQRISTHAVEFALSQEFNAASLPDLSQGSAFTYSEAGHPFYILNLSSGSWGYDPTANGMWHERAWLNTATGLNERVRQDHQVYWQGHHHFGDYATGDFFIQSLDYHTDNNNPLVRLRRTPHISMQGRLMTFDRLWVDMKVGVGADRGGSGSDPHAMLRYSDNGGRTWSNYLEASIGKIGEFLTRVEWFRLGSSRDRVFEFSVSDNVTVVLIASFADVRLGR